MNYNIKPQRFKSTSVALLSAAVILGLSACNPKPVTPEEPVEVAFKGTIVAQTEVRSAGDAWESGDEIGVFMLTAGQTLSDEALVDNAFNRNFITSNDGTFTPVNVSHKLLFPTGDGKVDFIAYHPYASDSRIKNYALPVSVADQTAAELYLLYSNAAKNAGKTSGTVALSFNHMLTGMAFPVTINGVEIENPEEVAITVKGMNATADFSLVSGKFTYTGSATDIVPVIPAQEEEPEEGEPVDEGLVFEAVILPTVGNPTSRSIEVSVPGVGSYTLDIPSDKVFEPGKIYEYPVEVSVHGITIVAGEITDWTGKNDGVEEGTANPPVRLPEKEWVDLPNTYIAAPGAKVQIPVKKAYAMWYYDSILGEEQESLVGKMTAELVWQETPGLIPPATGITITGEGMDAVINVQSNANAEYVSGVKGEGNAVIALKFGGEIYWTWQVWFTSYNPELTDGQVTNNGVTLMNRNLGAWDGTYASANIGRTAGTYYQWGRKDPLRIANNGMAGLNRVFFDDTTTNYVIPGAYHDNMKETAAENLVFSIRNPLRIIKNTAGADWLFNNTTALSSPDRWNKQDGSKGVYDPCPAGWRVPASGEGAASPWNGMTLPETVNISANKGVDFANFGFYLTNGYFAGDKGTVTQMGSMGQGYLWAASPGTTAGMIYCFNFSGTSVSPSKQMSASTTMPVRCAKIK